MDRLSMQAGIVERMSEGVLVVARDGIIHYANAVMERTLGYGRGALQGVDARSLSFRSPEAFDSLLQESFAAAAGGATVIDLETRRRDGTLLPLQARLSSFEVGAQPFVIAMFTDVSERRQLEREVLREATHVQQQVGGDLHEDLGQQLSGIAMILQGLSARATGGAGVAGTELDEVVGLLNGAVRRTRVLARGLSPVGTTALGMREGFEELVNDVQQVHGRRVRLSLDMPEELPVDENCATALFHIAREAVENAVRHAGARDIHIDCSAAGPDLELQVVDDGVGFDPALAGNAGMGLRMMRFRAEMASGYLSIESKPGNGARLRCRVPQGRTHDAERSAKGCATRVDSR